MCEYERKEAMTENTLDREGVFAALWAFSFWGLVPIYYKALQSVGVWEVLAQRILWSILFLLVFLVIQDPKKFVSKLRLPLKSFVWLSLSGLMISANWGMFVWAVAHDHVLETSLGYFGTPLINVVLGYLVLKERLTALQLIAVVIAASGTLYLAWYMGRPPWISISLAITFGFYGLLRKRLDVRPMLGLLWETTLMMIPALLYLAWLSSKGQMHFMHVSNNIDLLLAGSGLATVLPLIWFNMAAQKLPLSILGFFQYLAPSISFLLAVYLYDEKFTLGHAVAFTCIWLALVMVSIVPFRNVRRRLRG